jgi:hypothetical protein
MAAIRGLTCWGCAFRDRRSDTKRRFCSRPHPESGMAKLEDVQAHGWFDEHADLRDEAGLWKHAAGRTCQGYMPSSTAISPENEPTTNVPDVGVPEAVEERTCFACMYRARDEPGRFTCGRPPEATSSDIVDSMSHAWFESTKQHRFDSGNGRWLSVPMTPCPGLERVTPPPVEPPTPPKPYDGWVVVVRFRDIARHGLGRVLHAGLTRDEAKRKGDDDRLMCVLDDRPDPQAPLAHRIRGTPTVGQLVRISDLALGPDDAGNYRAGFLVDPWNAKAEIEAAAADLETTLTRILGPENAT